MNHFFIELGKKDKNIGLTFETGQCVNYLDIRLSVETSNFRTKVFRKLAGTSHNCDKRDADNKNGCGPLRVHHGTFHPKRSTNF